MMGQRAFEKAADSYARNEYRTAWGTGYLSITTEYYNDIKGWAKPTQEEHDRIERALADLRRSNSEANQVAVWKELNALWLRSTDSLGQQEKARFINATGQTSTRAKAQEVWGDMLVEHVKSNPAVDIDVPGAQYYNHFKARMLSGIRDPHEVWLVHKVLMDSWKNSRRRGAGAPPPPPVMNRTQQGQRPNQSAGQQQASQQGDQGVRRRSRGDILRQIQEDEILKNGTTAQKRRLARTSASQDTLRRLADSAHATIVLAVIHNKNTGDDIRDGKAGHKSRFVRAAVAEETKNPATLAKLGADKQNIVLLKVLSNINTDPLTIDTAINQLRTGSGIRKLTERAELFRLRNIATMVSKDSLFEAAINNIRTSKATLKNIAAGGLITERGGIVGLAKRRLEEDEILEIGTGSDRRELASTSWFQSTLRKLAQSGDVRAVVAVIGNSRTKEDILEEIRAGGLGDNPAVRAALAARQESGR